MAALKNAHQRFFCARSVRVLLIVSILCNAIWSWKRWRTTPDTTLESRRDKEVTPRISSSASVENCLQLCFRKKEVDDFSKDCEVAMQQEREQHGKEILRSLQDQCVKGSVEACEQEAWLYLKGSPPLLIPEDVSRGLGLLETFCQKGCEALAWAYEGRISLEGVMINPEHALALYQRACAAGNTRACIREASLQRELKLSDDEKEYQQKLLQQCLRQSMDLRERDNPCEEWAKSKFRHQGD